MAKEILDLSVNEIKDLAVADFLGLTEKIQGLKKYQLIALGKKLAIPRYTVLSREGLFRAILGYLSNEESEFAEALVSMEELSEELDEPVRDITFQLLTTSVLEERTYPSNTTMSEILLDLNMSNKTVAIQGEIISKYRLDQTIEQLGVEGNIVSVISKVANA